MGRDYPTAEQCEKQGKVLRQGTVDKRGTVRCPTCVKDTGRKGSSGAATQRIVVRQGTLFPWKAMEPANVRHAALHIAVERHMHEKASSDHDAAIAIARKLNVLYIYRKNDARPAVALTCNRVLDDEEWLRQAYGLAPLDRTARQCQLSEKAALRATASANAKRQTNKGRKKATKKATSKKPSQFRSAKTWPQFLAANKGKGHTMSDLSAAWAAMH